MTVESNMSGDLAMDCLYAGGIFDKFSRISLDFIPTPQNYERLVEEGSIGRKLKLCRGHYDSLFYHFGSCNWPRIPVGLGLYAFFDTAQRARYIGQGDVQKRPDAHDAGYTAAGKLLRHTSDYPRYLNGMYCLAEADKGGPVWHTVRWIVAEDTDECRDQVLTEHEGRALRQLREKYWKQYRRRILCKERFSASWPCA